MLMSVTCQAITSVGVTLKYDDNTTKNVTIALNDLISVTYVKNGVRRTTEGKVIYINATGNDANNWYIIIDKSEDYESSQDRFCPMNILDVTILRTSSSIKTVQTPNDNYVCPYIRIVDKKLQYSTDGVHWYAVLVDSSDIDIKDESGTITEDTTTSDTDSSSDDTISEESGS